MSPDELTRWQELYAAQAPSEEFADRVMSSVLADQPARDALASESKGDKSEAVSRRVMPWLMVTAACIVAFLRIGHAFSLWTM